MLGFISQGWVRWSHRTCREVRFSGGLQHGSLTGGGDTGPLLVVILS